MKTAVVILNYNGRHLLERFLPSVAGHTSGAAIVVADNASTDGSVAWLREHFPQVQCLCNPRNEGYAGGYNAALRQLDAECYVLLNSDVEVTPGWLPPLTGLLAAHPQAAACQPKLLQHARRTHFEYAGAAGGFMDRFGYPFCRGRLFQDTEPDTGQYDDTRPVFWASGACLAVRASDFWAAGGLDEAFFAHMEEIDLCWRLQNRGRTIYYCAGSTVYHVGAGTLAPTHPRKTFLNFRNSLAMLYKNLPTDRLVFTIFMRLLLDGLAGAVFLLQKRPLHCWAVVRAHFTFYKNFSFWMKQRSQTVRKKNAAMQGSYEGSVVWAYFVRKQKKFSQLRF